MCSSTRGMIPVTHFSAVSSSGVSHSLVVLSVLASYIVFSPSIIVFSVISFVVTYIILLFGLVNLLSLVVSVRIDTAKFRKQSTFYSHFCKFLQHYALTSTSARRSVLVGLAYIARLHFLQAIFQLI